MMQILGSIIVAVLGLVGVIITNAQSNKKIEQNLQISQAVTNTKIEQLTEEVKKHNSFAEKIPTLEYRVGNLEAQIKEVKEL